MAPEKEFAARWFEKASNDLMAARAVLDSEYQITDVPCFHAQQCVEKSLKGMLTWNGVRFGRTHDLMLLLAEVVKINESFLSFREVCAELCEFAVDVRYPGDIAEPPQSEARRFVDAAEKVLKLARECC